MKTNELNIISIIELEKYTNDRILLIDIRDRQKYLRGHIPGAIYRTENEIYKIKDIFSKYDKVYIYCDYGNNGMKVVKNLQMKYNINNVYNIIGGFNVYRGRIER